MSKSVDVIFDNSGKCYTYKIPDYIKKEIQVGDYVIIDVRHTPWNNLGCKTAKVVNVFDGSETPSMRASSYIMDTVKLNRYKKFEEKKKKEAEIREEMEKLARQIEEEFCEAVLEDSLEKMACETEVGSKLYEKYTELSKLLGQESE